MLVHISNGTGLIWDPDTILELRTRHHVVGALIGTLPRMPLQNVFKSLPLVLMPEEVTLLLENGLALAVDGAASHRSPSQSEIDADALNARRNDSGDIPDAAAFRLRAKSKQSDVASDSERDGDSDAFFTPVASPLPARAASPTPSSTPSIIFAPAPINIVTTYAASRTLPWFEPKGVDITEARRSELWTWPRTDAERLRLKVFKGLWDKGYYISSGSKFGGDYLMYPGDPSRYHSHFVVSIVAPDRAFGPLDAVTFGRLGTTVKKSHAVCSWDEDRDELVSFCVQWSGWN
ncbi:hypothetical protein BDK51DRAFT_17230 [Blyttiomyces helicus]|uniref:tRNA-splicing endonuclease subunit Sen34 n=1 Tax=Blyttiomyces helicus TaxID=388810 RepID=A0A4P9WIR2_9FUNG|nr:hypothetical protein BDK51DRAFT_17230 [Blyttiomyces helicus]|eukprot:RKO92684.1 hypothetical protein BDK51DRAFT_17230 [Blyttiomyces helicus]